MIDPVTSRYAEALFNLAEERGALERVQRDVEGLSEALAQPDAAAFFFDARISLETRRAKLEPFLEGADDVVRNLVGLLFDKRRADVLRTLGPAFRKRLLEAQGRAEGVVESARPLSPEDVDRVARALGRQLGKTVVLENRVVAGLIGGVRVIVENKMMDVSLRGRLGALRKRMLEAPLPAGKEG